MSAGMSDEQLMGLIGDGDKQAFQQFLLRHLKNIMRFVTRYTGKHDAEDIAQEAFTRVWTHAGTWKDQGVSPVSWLYRVSYNLSMDHLRRRKPAESEDAIAELAGNVQMEPEQQAINNSQEKLLQQALSFLPERQYTALTLCAWQGLSNRDASSIMGISVDALESLLSRARRSLKQLLTETKGQTS